MVTDKQRADIERLLGEGQLSQNEIARRVGCSRTAVQNAAKGKPTQAKVYPIQQGAKQVNLETPANWAPNRYRSDKLPSSVLVLPDIQFPFNHPQALQFLSMAAHKYQVNAVVGIGDEIDAYALSAYEKDPEIYEASGEYERTLKLLDRLYELFPNVIALHSNHGRGRLEAARKRGGFLRSQVPDYHTFIKAPRGWAFYDEVILGDVLLIHGDGEKALSKPYLERHIPAEYGRHYSVIHGHRHEMVGRQAHAVVGDKEYWAAYTGCLINPYHPAFGYTKARKAKLGCGLIIHGEYKQLRMTTDNQGVWDGSL
jgi:hypothetical protein